VEVVREEGASKGGRGRKLQLDGGRAATRVKISERRRCWTAVSCEAGGSMVGGVDGDWSVAGVRAGCRIWSSVAARYC